MWFPTLKNRQIIDLESGLSITAEQLVKSVSGATSNAATSGAVAIPLTKTYQGYTTNTTADIAATLADGIDGQEIWIKLETKDTSDMVLTPANFNNGSTLTFDATGEIAHLKFVGTGWEVLYTTATVA
jgi:hypothetical protein